MLATSTGLPFAISTASVDNRYRLGELYEYWHPTYGQQIYRYIQNKSGSTMSIGLGAMQENGTDKYEANLSGASTPNVRMLGVAQWAILNAYYSFVLCDGMGQFQSDGTTTADTVQLTAAAGQFTDGTAVTSENCVWAMETESPAGAAGLFVGIIRCL